MSKDIENELSKIGEIISAKSSFEIDNGVVKKGFGFVTFRDSNSAKIALEKMKEYGIDGMICEKYEIKEKGSNNIYVKDFPSAWTEDQIKTLFTKYGNIKSLIVREHEVPGKNVSARFAFICFEHPDGTLGNK